MEKYDQLDEKRQTIEKPQLQITLHGSSKFSQCATCLSMLYCLPRSPSCSGCCFSPLQMCAAHAESLHRGAAERRRLRALHDGPRGHAGERYPLSLRRSYGTGYSHARHGSAFSSPATNRTHFGRNDASFRFVFFTFPKRRIIWNDS